MNYNFSSKTYCPQPFSNIEISVQGLYKICCLANKDEDFGHIKDTQGNYLHVLDHDVKDVFNAPTLREHRLQLSRNEEPARCLNCFDKERSASGSSVRLARNEMKSRIIEIVDVEQADKLMKLDGSVDHLPVTLDVRFGNLCNSKCITCNPANSSFWMEDAQKIYPEKIKTVFREEIKEFGARSRWWESQQWWDQFEKIAPNLRSVYPIGGEPLIMPQHDTMLQKLVDWGYAKNIELEYDTNLTVINPRLINLWKQFKSIQLRVSIDETGDRYHLVRNPGKWETLIKNINLLRSEGIPIRGFTSSIGLPTIYSPFRLYPFSKEYNIEYFQRFLYIPEGMDITILPPSAKQEIIDTYINTEDQTGEKGSTIINHLLDHFDVHRPDRITNFVRYMNKLDEVRNTNWKSTLSDVYSILSRHCPESFV